MTEDTIIFQFTTSMRRKVTFGILMLEQRRNNRVTIDKAVLLSERLCKMLSDAIFGEMSHSKRPRCSVNYLYNDIPRMFR